MFIDKWLEKENIDVCTTESYSALEGNPAILRKNL